MTTPHIDPRKVPPIVRRPRSAGSRYRLPFGALVGTTLRVYFGNLVPFLLLAVMTLGPWIVMRFYSEHAIDWDGWQEMTREQVRALRERAVLYDRIAWALDSLGTQVLTGALTFGVVQRLRGEPASIDRILGTGVKSFVAVLAVGIVTGMLIGIAMLLIVPGLLLMTIWYVALPVAVLERKSVSGAMQRSADLTRGSRWPLFGAATLVLVVMLGTGMLLEWVYADSGVPAWLEVLVNVLLVPFGATLPAVAYYMLRTHKENIDARKIAAVFD